MVEMDELDYILKTHACTQINYDRASQDDYPKMVEKILQWNNSKIVEALSNLKSKSERVLVRTNVRDMDMQMNVVTESVIDAAITKYGEKKRVK